MEDIKANLKAVRENIPEDASSPVMKRARAEAHVFRAMAYLDLIPYWGTPVLVDHVLSAAEYSSPNGNPTELWALVESDLTTAISGGLDEKSSANDWTYRVTKGFAQALLGKAYILQKKWSEAASILETLIGSGKYELESSMEDLMTLKGEESKETLFESNYVYDQSQSTGMANMLWVYVQWRGGGMWDHTAEAVFTNTRKTTGLSVKKNVVSSEEADQLMEDVKIIGARRNGVAIGARNVIIRNCHFENCGIKAVHGTPPRCAIDFEPDAVKKYPEIGNQNVLMEKCTFKNNYYDVGSYRNNLESYGKIATTIKNCRFSAPLKIQGTYWMRFENCYIPFVWNSQDKRSVLLYSKHMEFINCEFAELDTTMLGLATRWYNKYSHCKYNTKKK